MTCPQYSPPSLYSEYSLHSANYPFVSIAPFARSMGRDVTSLTLVCGAEDLAALAPVLGDVLAGTRVASHATAEEKLPEAGSFEVRDAVFAPRS